MLARARDPKGVPGSPDTVTTAQLSRVVSAAEHEAAMHMIKDCDFHNAVRSRCPEIDQLHHNFRELPCYTLSLHRRNTTSSAWRTPPQQASLPDWSG